MSANTLTLNDVIKRPKKRGRPRKEVSRADENKPTRIPVSGNRDILTVQGKDKDYEYRWIVDADENGHRIFRFMQGGWEFATTEQGLKIGQAAIYKSENVGSILRVPAGKTIASKGEYQYLMRIKKQFYREDQVAKEKALKETERKSFKADKDMTAEGMGQYGQTDVETEFKYVNQS